MREILFRGKRVDNGEWITGYYIKANHHWHSQGIHEDWFVVDTIQNGGWCNVRGKYAIIPETVGQYTGLADKNGTKIFEGDIIKFGINQRLMYVHWNEETLTWELTDIGIPTCEVNHLMNTFDLGEIQVESAYGEMFSEIVGNIHDNRLEDF